MAKIPPDERLIYLAFKNIFIGMDAQTRNVSTIKKKIQKHKKGSAEIQALVQAHNVDNLANSVKLLLEGGVFESTLRAKIRFPEMFDVSPAQSAERAASEAEAAQIEAETIRDIVVVQHDESVVSTCVEEEALDAKGKGKQPAFAPDPKLAPVEKLSTQSLYPLYLPMRSQCRLLGKVQDLLEHACFRFGERMMPKTLQKQMWDSPECGELNIWSGLFRSKETAFHPDRMAALGKSFADLLSSVAQIRHTAVHRIRVTDSRVKSFLADAEAFATLLADETCARQLSRLRRETRSVVEEIGRNKDLLETQFLEKRRELAARRAELDRIERAAWETMHEEDRQYQFFAGSNLEEIIDLPETALHSRAPSEIDEDSEDDTEEYTEEDTSIESEGEPDFCCVGEPSQGPLLRDSVKQSGPSL